jgi:hypothetical protein
MLTAPYYQIAELGSQSLVNINNQVDQYDYGAAVGITLGDGVRPVSGELLSFMFYSSESGSGAVQTPAGVLLLFDAAPDIAAGDTSISLAARTSILGQVPVSASNWISDANGASQCILDKPIPFHNLKMIYAAWYHTDATSLNDAGGDDEYMAFNAWYRRDS